MSETPTESSDPDEFEESLSKSVQEDLEAKEPSDEERQALLDEHRHHLVRRTTSELTMEPEVVDGVEASATATVPDMFCFDCEEWVGLSGVDLRGKPRSRADAYYLDGPPEEVAEAKQDVREGLGSLAERALSAPSVDGPEDAFEFVATELEQVQRRVE